MKNNVNIILANAPINNGNRGCVALSITLLGIIDKIMIDAGVSYKIYLTDSQFYDNIEHEYKAFGKILRFNDLTYYSTGFGLKSNIKNIVKKIFLRNDNLKSFIKSVDYILDIGQGDSFSDIYGIERFQLIDNIHKLARLNHIPYCILPQTIGPFKNHEIKEAAFKSIVRATCCMARDKQSYDYVIKNVPALQNIKEYIDVAFFLPYKIIKQSPDYIHIGLNVSSLLWHGGYSQDNQFGLKCDYITVIRSIIEYFISFDNVKLHLISHVVSSERNVENDYAVCYDLWDYYRNNNLILAPLPLGPIDVKSYISGMDFFIGARMHATIGAFSSGVPVVPMAYSRKFNGLFLDTLSYPYMADMKIMSNDEVFNQVRFAFEHRYELKNCVRERMNSIVREKETLLIKDLQNFFFM